MLLADNSLFSLVLISFSFLFFPFSFVFLVFAIVVAVVFFQFITSASSSVLLALLFPSY